MNEPVDLREFLEAYLAEVDEHLTSANAQLLAIDASLRSGESTARPVRDLFRALHTIKGLSSMVGVDSIVAIAHRMETVLRNADRSGGRLPPEAIDVLLQAVRAIEQRVRALHDGSAVLPAPSGLLDALDGLEAETEPTAAPRAPVVALDPAITAKLATFDREAIARGVASGRRAISARFAPSVELAAEGISINAVREKLGAVAEIVKVVPMAAPQGPSAPAGLSFFLIALTSLTDEELARAIGVDVGAVASIAEPAPAPHATVPSGVASSAEEIERDADVRRTGVVRVDVSRLDAALERLSGLIVCRSQLALEITRLAETGVETRGLCVIARAQSRELKELRASILELRMVPLTEVLERVPLIVRGLRRATGKTVRLEMDVGRAELDKAVAEQIFPAIVHLVRNAIDHGIESREERLAEGKPEEGTLRIECIAVGNAQLELRIADDGRGIDREELARRAGGAVPESDAAVLQLLCRPGLSTRDRPSDTSGRGMGMDIVRRIVVEQLAGQLSMRSERGRGTTFSLRVPLTISVVDAFTFECGAQRFAVPLSTVDEIIELDLASIARGPVRGAPNASAAGVIERRGAAVSVVQLDALLGLTPAGEPAGPRSKGLVVRADGETVAFVVDRMLGQQEIVVHALEDPLVDVAGITGATDLGDGRPTLIVDLVALSARHLGEQLAANRLPSSAEAVS